MADSGISMPGGFGGLMRYNEEYDSRFKFKPSWVIGFIVIIIAFILALNIIFPISAV
jgi:preprotein translocase subunit Sec61beta